MTPPTPWRQRSPAGFNADITSHGARGDGGAHQARAAQPLSAPAGCGPARHRSGHPGGGGPATHALAENGLAENGLAEAGGSWAQFRLRPAGKYLGSLLAPGGRSRPARLSPAKLFHPTTAFPRTALLGTAFASSAFTRSAFARSACASTAGACTACNRTACANPVCNQLEPGPARHRQHSRRSPICTALPALAARRSPGGRSLRHPCPADLPAPAGQRHGRPATALSGPG